MYLRREHILRDFDSMLRETLLEQMLDDGIDIISRTQLMEVRKHADGSLILMDENNRQHDGFDQIIWAIGREPNTQGMQLDVANIKVDEQGFIEVLDAPTGMMMIKRAVLEKLCDAYPGLKYTPDHILGMEGIKDAIQDHHYRLFDVMTEENGRYLSEDYAFCRRWQNIGGKIYIDAQSNLSHQGGHLYTGNFLESLKARHVQHEAGLPEDVAGPRANQ